MNTFTVRSEACPELLSWRESSSRLNTVSGLLISRYSFWSWDKIFDTISDFTGGKDHKLKFLEPRVDFFTKHQSQFNTSEE